MFVSGEMGEWVVGRVWWECVCEVWDGDGFSDVTLCLCKERQRERERERERERKTGRERDEELFRLDAMRSDLI